MMSPTTARRILIDLLAPSAGQSPTLRRIYDHNIREIRLALMTILDQLYSTHGINPDHFNILRLEKRLRLEDQIAKVVTISRFLPGFWKYNTTLKIMVSRNRPATLEEIREYKRLLHDEDEHYLDSDESETPEDSEKTTTFSELEFNFGLTALSAAHGNSFHKWPESSSEQTHIFLDDNSSSQEIAEYISGLKWAITVLLTFDFHPTYPQPEDVETIRQQLLSQ